VFDNGRLEYSDVTPEMLTEKLMGFVGDWYQKVRSGMTVSLGIEHEVNKLRKDIRAELENWHTAMTKHLDPECDHPIEGCEAAMHKGAYVILCAKCMCFCLSAQDVWEPLEETLEGT